MSEATEQVYDTAKILAALPHRYPMLLVDRVVSLGEEEIHAVKAVSFNEGFFQGHFPGRPIMPGVLQIEALAQEMQQGQGEGQAQGERQGRGQGRDQLRNDPFDRPSSSYGALDGRSTKVPDQALIDRARDLMRELRRRAAETSRPQLELDYFQRLLERF